MTIRTWRSLPFQRTNHRLRPHRPLEMAHRKLLRRPHVEQNMIHCCSLARINVILNLNARHYSSLWIITEEAEKA